MGLLTHQYFCCAGDCPLAGFCGVPGLRDSSFRVFPIALRLDGHHGNSSAELPVRFRGDTINIHAWSRGSRDPRDLAVGFLAAQLTGSQNNLLEYIACNTYIYIYWPYIFIYICICDYKYMCILYMYVYMQIIWKTLVIFFNWTLVIILHGRVWSYYQCIPCTFAE